MSKGLIEIQSLMKRMDSRMTLTEAENFTRTLRGNDITIIEYLKDSEEWNKTILPNIDRIWEFLQIGYNGNFKGCDKPKKLKTNASLIKIAYNCDDWVALSVYNSYMGGNKCVGICRTRVNGLEELGRQGVEMIIRQDINNYDKFFWCECSDKIEEYYRNNKGINIPSAYAQTFLPKAIITIIDEFHYSRPLGEDRKEATKTIFGFNTPETFNKIYSEMKEYIDDCITRIKNGRITEDALKLGFSELTRWRAWILIIDVFVDLWRKGYHEFPKESINELLITLDEMVNAAKDVPMMMKNEFNEAINNGTYILNNSTELEIHEL